MRIVSTLLLIALASIITACPAQPATGKLDVTVTGPNKFSQTITAPGSTSTIIENLPLGSYKVVASDITANSKTYTPTITDSPATVNATTTSSISVVYATP
jgi:hypothetical protein